MSHEHSKSTNSYPRNGVLGAFRGHFELTLSISTSNCMCDACVMHTCTGLVGPKTGKVKKPLVFKAFLNGSKGAGVRQPNEQVSGPDRLGGGRGRVNPPPRRLVWRFWEVWRVCCLVGASTRLEARGLGGFRHHGDSEHNDEVNGTQERYCNYPICTSEFS